MKVWITKYALTEGITQLEAEPTSFPAMIKISAHEYCHGEGKEWHRTEADAIACAEIMRLAKIASLEKQIAKYRAMTFETMERKP